MAEASVPTWAAQCEALLWREALAPLEDAFGPYGAMALDVLSQEVSSAGRGGFASVLARALEGAR